VCHAAHAVFDKADTIACEDLTAPMKSAKYRHKDANRRLSGWVKGATSISRRRGSAPALVNPACTSQIDSRTGLLQGQRKGDRFHCIDGVVPDADANVACNIPVRLYDDEITLYTPFREVKALLAERTRTAVGTAPPGLELRGPATTTPSTESELPRRYRNVPVEGTGLDMTSFETPVSAAELRDLHSEWQDVAFPDANAESTYLKTEMLRHNWNSNRIEGSPMPYTDMVHLILNDYVAPAVDYRWHEESVGHFEALEQLADLEADVRWDEADLKSLHRQIMVRDRIRREAGGSYVVRAGEFKTLPNMVMTSEGKPHVFTMPEDVPTHLRKFLADYNARLSRAATDDIALELAEAHIGFANIHPFMDGNGRVTRLLVGVAADSFGYPNPVIAFQDRDRYMASLVPGNRGDPGALRDFLSVCIKQSLKFGLACKKGLCETGWRNLHGDPDMPTGDPLRQSGVRSSRNLADNLIHALSRNDDLIGTVAMPRQPDGPTADTP